MRKIAVLLALLGILSGCASIGFANTDRVDSLWGEANSALDAGRFEEAGELFAALAARHPNRVEGREAVFYMGVVSIDPRNPAWDPQPAEEHFARYLSLSEGEDVRLFRYLEARALHEMAVQLNLPSASRVPGLQAEQTQQPAPPPTRVVVPAAQNRELMAELERLRGQVAERDTRIQTQQEELDRIRRTLSAPRQ